MRRWRERCVEGGKAALDTLDQVLLRIRGFISPLLPFKGEYFYLTLTNSSVRESVHLEDYPEADKQLIKAEAETVKLMKEVRAIVSEIHMQRAKAKISLRQPLQKAVINCSANLAGRSDLIEILQNEINVFEVIVGKETEIDIELTEELINEGRFRELVRLIQDARKKEGLKVGQLVGFEYFTRDDQLQEIISSQQADLAKQASLKSIEQVADNVHLKRLANEEISIRFY